MRILATAGAILMLALTASAASANTGDIIAPQHPPNYTSADGWQAGTCKTDLPTCSVDTPSQFFETAAAHPPVGFTQFIVKHTTEEVGMLKFEKPVGELADVRVDLPVGLSVNPGATPRCDLAQFEGSAASCDPLAKVGTSFVSAADPILGVVAPPISADVYNLKPQPGEPALFGLELLGNEIFLKADVEWGGDFHEGFTIAVPKALELPGFEGFILKNRLVFDGTAGDGTFITTPSTCLGPAGTGPGQSGSIYSTWLLAASYGEEAAPGYQFPGSAAPAFESPIPPGTSPKDCATIPYAPGIAVDPGTAQANSPAGATVTATVPHIKGAANQDSSVTRSAAVALPVGMGLNPSAANGLQTCTDSQFPTKGKAATSCPGPSKVGTVEIQSPPLPEGNLTGDVFVGKQLSRDPESGDEYRIFIDAKSSKYGVEVRLLGRVRANPVTGQLTTTIAETPQVPFTSFKLSFTGGPRAALSSPPVCASKAAATMTPWSGNAAASPSGPIVLSSAPGGGPCAKTLAERPFAPAFSARPKGTKAGAYSPVALRITRGDGQQELKGVDVTLAPGMTGKLAGIPYCPPSALAAAAASAGANEQANSSCPAKSLVGSATIAAGTGSAPLQIAGKVFLSGPYRGAPLSLAVITPATAGPFDLGTVVVRVALFVDPDTAQIRALSDPIPDVYGGTQLSVRSVAVDIDRKDFTLNPTSCGPLTSSGTLNGGGADPANPAAFSAFPVSTPFQTSDCGSLGFKPKLFTRLYGGKKATKRAQHPKFRAVLVAREGDANIARAAVTLPHSQFLDQSHIRTICTRVQLAANDCPQAAIYGYARAQTPLLGDELAGPVYLVSSNHELPDLLADLKGQVDVRLRGVISAAKARIKNVFYPVPDVPVSKFVLTMKGGKRGLLVNSRDLCAKPSFSFMNFKAQNGKPLRKKRLPLRVPACHQRGGGKHKR
ncbi:MAG TPA: hypothetical protein VGO36_00345 [Solirubrobacterales bacterium]|jgi:hypothetical protein|nr:hypothetical protein [Solirubrobacterales bacterium]